MTPASCMLFGAGGALLGMGGLLCLLAETRYGGSIFALGGMLVMHLWLRSRRP